MDNQGKPKLDHDKWAQYVAKSQQKKKMQKQVNQGKRKKKLNF